MNQLKQLVYMRQMPSNLIAFSSKEGKQLFKEALGQQTMECYFPLAEQFITQLHPTTCGSTTLVMVLNALKIDPEVQWKGIWRWYTEENLHGLKPEHLEKGIDLDELSHIAKHNKVAFKTFYHPDLYSLQFNQKKQKVTFIGSYYDCRDQCFKLENQYKVASFSTFCLCLEASARMERFFMIVNNSRKALGQTGEGHFSPIGGVHLAQQKVMLFDVARFKYPPQWCSFELLYKSIAPIDKDNNMTRGFGLIGKPFDYECKNLYSREQFQNWIKSRTDFSNLSQHLSLLLVYYLFLVLQRIEYGKTKIITEKFTQILSEETKISIEQANKLLNQEIILKSLINDFTSQFPGLSNTIACILYNTIYGYHLNHRELNEEFDLIRLILGI